MAIGEKVFEHSGKVTGFKITKVHPIDGIVTETSFVTDVKGFGKFPNAKNTGSSITTQYPSNGIFDASMQGIAITTEGGDQIFWWAHQKTRIVEQGGNGGKRKGIAIVSFFSNSQKLSWINSTIVVDDVEMDLATQEMKIVGYEWI